MRVKRQLSTFSLPIIWLKSSQLSWWWSINTASTLWSHSIHTVWLEERRSPFSTPRSSYWDITLFLEKLRWVVNFLFIYLTIKGNSIIAMHHLFFCFILNLYFKRNTVTVWLIMRKLFLRPKKPSAINIMNVILLFG